MSGRNAWKMVAFGAFTLALCTEAAAQPAPKPGGQSEQVAARLQAEKLEREGKHIACGDAYMGIYSQAPGAQSAVEVLYNAGVCFEMGHALGLAMKAYSLLEKRFPSSRHAAKALLRRGSLAAQAIDFQQAAEAYERYAKRYGGERDAPTALQNAIRYRKALGHDEEAIANTERFLKIYRKRLKRESAAALFGLAGMREQQGVDKVTIAAYKRYLTEFGRSGGADRLVIANAKIAGILWRQSCPGQDEASGSCLRIKRGARVSPSAKATSKQPTRCGPESIVRFEVRPRNKAKTKEATKFFRRAVSLATRSTAFDGLDASRKAAAIYWLSAARFTLLEAGYEDYLAIEFPKGLSFSAHNEKKKQDSERRFNEWITSTKEAATALGRQYGEVKNRIGGGPSWAIAAALRAAQVQHHFARLLQTAEIPKNVRTGPYAEDGVDAYCSALTSAASPLEQNAILGFDFVLVLGSKTNFFNKWSRIAERELSQLRPDDYPLPSEHHGDSRAVGDILDLEALESEWPQRAGVESR